MPTCGTAILTLLIKWDSRLSLWWLWRLLFFGMLRRVICWNVIIIGDESAASIFRTEDRGRWFSETLVTVYPWYWILSVSVSEPEISTALRTGTHVWTLYSQNWIQVIQIYRAPFQATAVRTATFPIDTIPETKKGATRRRGKRPWSTGKGCHFQSRSRYLLNNPVLWSCCLLYICSGQRFLRFACENVFMVYLTALSLSQTM
jgi:hypothetical protein